MTKTAFTRAEPDTRRQSIINATRRVLAREGARGTTVRQIALEAGVSPGLINHYFSSVDTLIAATHTHVLQDTADALMAAVEAAAPDPRSRLLAYAKASFVAPIADPGGLSTWTAFWGLVKIRPELGRAHDEGYERYRSQLEALLADCGVAEPQRRLAAIGIAGLIDGLWLERCLSADSFTADEAGAIVERHVMALLAQP